MALSIGRNINSTFIQHHLDAASERLSKAYTQLSSGQRINSASDDAAGLSIALSLNADVRIKTQAIRNVNDGISLTSIATAALGACRDITVRQRELAEQAANGLYSSKQRSAIANEASKLTDEYNRIIATTTFNGQKLLNDPTKSINIQAGGPDPNNTLSLSLGQSLATTTTIVNGGSNTLEPGSYLTVGGNDASDIYLWFKVGTRGVDPNSIGGSVPGIGFEVDLSVAQATSPTSISQAVATALQSTGQFSTSFPSLGVVRATNLQNRNATDAADGNTGATVSVVQQGYNATGSNILPDTGSIAPVDINGDGKVDFLQLNGGPRIMPLFGNGDGTWTAGTSYVVGADTIASDGSHFLLSAWGILNKYSVNPDGSLSTTASGAVSFQEVYNPTFDKNGGIIAISACGPTDSNDSTLYHYTDGGNGTLYADAGAQLTTLGAVTDMKAGDFNGDGNTDAAIVYNDGTVEFWFNDNAGGFTNVGSLSVGTTPNQYSVAVGDFNGDGKSDVVIADGRNLGVGGAEVWTSNGDGTFALSNTYAPLSGTTVNKVVTGDFNSDGYTDLLTIGASSGDQYAEAFINDGSGNFTGKNIFDVGSAPEQIILGSVTGSGYPDLVVRSGATLTSYSNEGTGNFSTISAIPSRPEISDLNFNTVPFDYNIGGSTTTTSTTYIDNIDLSSTSTALDSMSTLDDRLQRISGELSNVGAFESRLNTAAQTLMSNRENEQAAYSRIMDVDVASAVSEMTRTQILQNIGSAVLAQANQEPGLVMKLL